MKEASLLHWKICQYRSWMVGKPTSGWSALPRFIFVHLQYKSNIHGENGQQSCSFDAKGKLQNLISVQRLKASSSKAVQNCEKAREGDTYTHNWQAAMGWTARYMSDIHRPKIYLTSSRFGYTRRLHHDYTADGVAAVPQLCATYVQTSGVN
jgi:hypothetical protein